MITNQILVYMQNGAKIEAIKELRAATGLGLKEAKDIIELFWDSVTGTQGIPAGYDKFEQKPYKEETYHVFCRRMEEHDWQCTYIGNIKEYAMDDARGQCDNGKETLLLQVVARSKYVLEEV